MWQDKKLWKKKSGGGGSDSNWCSVHKSTHDSDTECRKQQEANKKPAAPPAQANFAHVGNNFPCGFRSVAPYVWLSLRRWLIVVGSCGSSVAETRQ